MKAQTKAQTKQMNCKRALFVRKVFATNKMREQAKLKILTPMLGKYRPGPTLTWLTFLVVKLIQNLKEPTKNKKRNVKKVKVIELKEEEKQKVMI